MRPTPDERTGPSADSQLDGDDVLTADRLATPMAWPWPGRSLPSRGDARV